MKVNEAIKIVNKCDRSPLEKSHLRGLIRNGGILPDTFAGTPDFAEILEDFPAGKIKFHSTLTIH